MVPTKKTAKPKSRAKKKASTTPEVELGTPTAGPTIPLLERIAADETFQTNGETHTLPKGYINLFINGQSKGQAVVGGKTVGQFALAEAKKQGIRSFSVYVNGTKITRDQGNLSLDPYEKMEIVAKDARG